MITSGCPTPSAFPVPVCRVRGYEGFSPPRGGPRQIAAAVRRRVVFAQQNCPSLFPGHQGGRSGSVGPACQSIFVQWREDAPAVGPRHFASRNGSRWRWGRTVGVGLEILFAGGWDAWGGLYVSRQPSVSRLGGGAFNGRRGPDGADGGAGKQSGSGSGSFANGTDRPRTRARPAPGCRGGRAGRQACAGTWMGPWVRTARGWAHSRGSGSRDWLQPEHEHVHEHAAPLRGAIEPAGGRDDKNHQGAGWGRAEHQAPQNEKNRQGGGWGRVGGGGRTALLSSGVGD